MNKGMPHDKIAACLRSERGIPDHIAREWVSQVAIIRHQVSEKAMLKGEILGILKEVTFFLVGTTGNFAICVLLSLAIGLTAPIAPDIFVTFLEKAGGLGVSAAVAFLAKLLGSWGLLVGCLVGYALYWVWLFYG